MSAHYTPVDSRGVPLIARCAGSCGREVVTSARNRVGTQYMCCHCRQRDQAKAA
jgi:hypothetical protein